MLHSFDTNLEELHSYETDFVKILFYDLKAGYSGNYQSKGYARFCTILNGDKQISVSDKSFTYDKNKSLLLPAYSKVYMDIRKPTKALVFELNNDLIESVVKKANIELDEQVHKDPTTQLLLNNLDVDIKSDLSGLMKVSKSSKMDHFLIDIYAQKLIYNLLRRSSSNNILLNQTYNPMERAMEFMKKNINESISTKDISNVLNMSTSNFSHSFKKYVGLSPNKYMQKLKLEKSKNMLKTTSVTEVAFELGYENPSYFIRLFKEFYGITPKQYQKVS